jgi:hypothetical protein
MGDRNSYLLTDGEMDSLFNAFSEAVSGDAAACDRYLSALSHEALAVAVRANDTFASAIREAALDKVRPVTYEGVH